MKYSVNWETIGNTHGAKEGSTIIINTPGAQEIVFGVYKNGFPVIIGQKAGDSISFVLKRANMSLKGSATLKVTAYGSKWEGYGWKDDFVIV